MQKTILITLIGVGVLGLAAYGLSRPKIQTVSPTSSEKVSESKTTESIIVTEPTVLADGEYQVNSETSRVAWYAAKVTASHTGTVAVKSGSLQINDGLLTNASFILNMDSISSDQNLDGLIKHLKSADFFDVAVYPEAKLTINSSQPGSSSDEYVLTGDLTIKDITAPVIFTAKITAANNNLDAKASFVIDRTNWNIKFLSGNFFKDLGDKAIADEIKFDITLNASK